MSTPTRRTQSGCCARHERPCCGHAAEKRSELASFRRITSRAGQEVLNRGERGLAPPTERIAHLDQARDRCTAGVRAGRLGVKLDPSIRRTRSRHVRFAPKATVADQNVIRRYVPIAS
jgi:hypothetical protein